MFFVGTDTKEMMSALRIFGVVLWQLMCDDFGDFEMMSA
jgi:hypothetical protein